MNLGSRDHAQQAYTLPGKVKGRAGETEKKVHISCMDLWLK